MFVAPSALEPDDSLEMAEAAMLLHDVSHLPVTVDDELVGVVSLRAVLSGEILAREDGDRRAERVSCVMSPPVAVRPDDTLVEAAETVCRHHVSCLPVVEGIHLVGMVTSVDLVRYAIELLEREAAHVGAAPQVGRLMTPGPVVTVRPTDPLAVAEVLMRHGHVRHLPVMTGERLCGILAQRETLVAMRSRPDVPVARVMTRAPLCETDPETEAAAAAHVLVDRRIGALPVLRAQRLIGMLTKSDYLAYVVSCALPAGAAAAVWKG
ncbi:MAG TPA: CBS domain-containing protein [Polyangia bacterium]|nr:CBS domain-containing protein [Polyangia bacterium]